MNNFKQDSLVAARFGAALFLGTFQKITEEFIMLGKVKKPVTTSFLEIIEKEFSQIPVVLTYDINFPKAKLEFIADVSVPPTEPLPNTKDEQ